MQRLMITSAVILLLVLNAAMVCGAKTELQVYQTLKLESEPLDISVAKRSGRVYVLNDRGEIAIYTFNGQLKGKLVVGADVVQIEPGPSEDTLFLLKRKNKAIESILVTVTEQIDVSGAPAKGADDAPVTVVVFSDFQ